LLRDGAFRGAADLSRQTLLHSLARRDDWHAWLNSVGFRSVDSQRGLKFENSALSYEAALQGIGVAIGMRVLVEPYLREGTLVCPFPDICTLNEGYYLIRPKNRPTTPALRSFQEWLLREAKLAAASSLTPAANLPPARESMIGELTK
jgi:LysR family glycine cleavage system transcriptional activator